MKINEVILNERNPLQTAAKWAAAASPFSKATFIGPEAKTWNQDSNDMARQMAKDGYEKELIWKQTGNWRGPDGKWRQEIDDSKMRLHRDPSKAFKGKMPDVLDHPELYKAYPELKNTDAEHWDNSDDPTLQGGYRYQNGKMGQGDRLRTGTRSPYNTPQTDDGALDVIGHEIQHAADNKEKFQAGSGYMSKAAKRVRDLLRLDGVPASDYDAYASFGGEVTARATAKRKDLDANQRAKRYPGLDIEPDELITIDQPKVPDNVNPSRVYKDPTGKRVTYRSPSI